MVAVFVHCRDSRQANLQNQADAEAALIKNSDYFSRCFVIAFLNGLFYSRKTGFIGVLLPADGTARFYSRSDSSAKTYHCVLWQ